MTANNEILNAQEAAQLLGAHVETVRRMARRGALPAYKIGKDWRFRKDALLAWSQPNQYQSLRATILVLEDDGGKGMGVSPYLENAGYRVVHVTDGAQALSLTRKDSIDLVFIDLNLSPTKGVEFIGVLRLTHPQLPIVVTSDGEDNHLLKGAFQHGPFIWVPKPLERETLISAVRMTLAGSLAEQAAS
jgi:excisionase family DNA binding protein